MGKNHCCKCRVWRGWRRSWSSEILLCGELGIQYHWMSLGCWQYLKSNDYLATNESIFTMENFQICTKCTTISSFDHIWCPLLSEWILYHETSLCRDSMPAAYSLGKRIFDVHIQELSHLFFSLAYSRGFDWFNLLQEKLALKDSNIENDAQGLDKAVIKNFTAVVMNKILMIRFHWAGKGTTAAPKKRDIVLLCQPICWIC